MSEVAVDQFLEEIGKYPAMWDCLELKAVGANKGESLLLLALSCTLCAALHPAKETLFETPNLVMVKEIRPLSELRITLSNLSNGDVTVADRAFSVEGFTLFECRTWGGGGQGWVDTNYPYVLLYSTGKSVQELVDESNIHRSLQQWGYRYIWDVSQEKVGFPVGGSYISQIRFVAPIYLEAEAAFVDDRFRIVLRCWPSLKIEDLSASYEITLNYFGKRQVERNKLDFLDALRMDDAVSFNLVKELDLMPQVELVFIWLFHVSRSEPLYTLRILRPATAKTNPVWSAMKLVLARREGGRVVYAEDILRECLGLVGKVTDSGRFETAIHNLLCCLGYSCIFVGRQWGIQGIDTLAFEPNSDRVLAVSVTTSNNIAEKIRTMLQQLENLRKGLERITIVLIICAAISPDSVLYSDQEDAKAHQISLILLPQLEQTLSNILSLPMSEARKQWESMLEGTQETILQ